MRNHACGRRWRCGLTLTVFAPGALLFVGCQPARFDPAAEQLAAAATGLGRPIALRVQGGPVDEAAPDPDRLTLVEAVDLAVHTDPSLQAALARVRIAMADADQARLLPNPVLDIALRWGDGLTGKPTIEAALAADLIEVLRIPRRSSATDHRLRQAAADAVTAAIDVLAEVQERYAAAQAADEVVPVLEERLILLGRLNTVARARLDGGEGTLADVTTLEAQAVELEVELAEAKLAQRRERIALARLIGEPSSAAAWRLESWRVPDLAPGDASRWISVALEHRPEVQAIVWSLAALGDEMALTTLWPWEGTEVGIVAERDGGWSVGPAASVPIPVFDMGQAQRARVTAEQIEARHNLTLARRRVVEEVRLAYEHLEASRDNLRRVQDVLVPLQVQRRQQAETAFLSGQTDVTGLFLAEQDLRATEVQAINIELQAIVSAVRLQRAVGGAGAWQAVQVRAPAEELKEEDNR